MTKHEFADIAQTLRACYCNDERFLSTKEMLDIWYRKIGHIEYKVVEKVIDNWIKTKRYSPMISDVLSECDVVSKCLDRQRDVENKNNGLDQVVSLKDDESNLEEFERDRELHPYEDGWLINDDGYWIQIGVRR